MEEITSSPSKWVTEQRQNYRVFIESPNKDKKDEKENEDKNQGEGD